MKWIKCTKEVVNEQLEYNGAVIQITSIGTCFQVYLQLGQIIIELGEFETLREAKKYVKNGIEQIDSIIQHLIAIQREVHDFCCEPE
jgi:hypothetical protein